MEQWIDGCFFRNNQYLTTIRAFCQKFALNSHDLVPSRNTINLWVKNTWKTASVWKKINPPGCEKSVQTFTNAAGVREALVTSPTRWAIKQASALGSYCTFFLWTTKNQLHNISARWPHLPHIKDFNGKILRRIFGSCLISCFTSFGLPVGLAASLNRPIHVWFLFLGLSEVSCVYFQAAYSGQTTG